MHSVLFEIGHFHIYSYGLMIAVGVLAAFFWGCRRAARSGLSSDEMFNMGFIGIVGGLIGAKLLYYLTELPAILEDPSLLLNLGEGFVVYGGLIAGILCPLIYTRRRKLALKPYLDCAVPGIALAQGFGRIGCFLAGCCYGKQTEAWYGVVFPQGSLAPAGVRLIPTQLISSAGDFLLVLVLWQIGKKNEKPGFVTAMYLILYSAGRFAVEFLRNDARGAVGLLSTSQFIAVFTLTAGVIMAVYCRKDGAFYGKGEKR